MVGFVIATHGKLASGFLDAVKLIIGEQENIGEIGLFEGNDISEFGLKLEKLIRKEDDGEGVVVFTDLFAASPYNQAALCANRITDVNSNKNRTSLEYPAKIIYKKIITPKNSSEINKDFERLILICCNVKYGFLMKYRQNKNAKNPANTTIITFSYIIINSFFVILKLLYQNLLL